MPVWSGWFSRFICKSTSFCPLLSTSWNVFGYIFTTSKQFFFSSFRVGFWQKVRASLETILTNSRLTDPGSCLPSWQNVKKDLGIFCQGTTKLVNSCDWWWLWTGEPNDNDESNERLALLAPQPEEKNWIVLGAQSPRQNYIFSNWILGYFQTLNIINFSTLLTIPYLLYIVNLFYGFDSYM